MHQEGGPRLLEKVIWSILAGLTLELAVHPSGNTKEFRYLGQRIPGLYLHGQIEAGAWPLLGFHLTPPAQGKRGRSLRTLLGHRL